MREGGGGGGGGGGKSPASASGSSTLSSNGSVASVCRACLSFTSASTSGIVTASSANVSRRNPLTMALVSMTASQEGHGEQPQLDVEWTKYHTQGPSLPEGTCSNDGLEYSIPPPLVPSPRLLPVPVPVPSPSPSRLHHVPSICVCTSNTLKVSRAG